MVATIVATSAEVHLCFYGTILIGGKLVSEVVTSITGSSPVASTMLALGVRPTALAKKRRAARNARARR